MQLILLENNAADIRCYFKISQLLVNVKATTMDACCDNACGNGLPVNPGRTTFFFLKQRKLTLRDSILPVNITLATIFAFIKCSVYSLYAWLDN